MVLGSCKDSENNSGELKFFLKRQTLYVKIVEKKYQFCEKPFNEIGHENKKLKRRILIATEV